MRVLQHSGTSKTNVAANCDISSINRSYPAVVCRYQCGQYLKTKQQSTSLRIKFFCEAATLDFEHGERILAQVQSCIRPERSCSSPISEAELCIRRRSAGEVGWPAHALDSCQNPPVAAYRSSWRMCSREPRKFARALPMRMLC